MSSPRKTTIKRTLQLTNTFSLKEIIDQTFLFTDAEIQNLNLQDISEETLNQWIKDLEITLKTTSDSLKIKKTPTELDRSQECDSLKIEKTPTELDENQECELIVITMWNNLKLEQSKKQLENENERIKILSEVFIKRKEEIRKQEEMKEKEKEKQSTNDQLNNIKNKVDTYTKSLQPQWALYSIFFSDKDIEKAAVALSMFINSVIKSNGLDDIPPTENLTDHWKVLIKNEPLHALFKESQKFFSKDTNESIKTNMDNNINKFRNEISENLLIY